MLLTASNETLPFRSALGREGPEGSFASLGLMGGLCGLANVPDGAGMGGLAGGVVSLFVRFLLRNGQTVRVKTLSRA